MIPSERWRHIEDLFHSALERSARERPSFLDKEAGGDIDLRQQVELLLASFEEAGDFIEESPVAGALSSIADRVAGSAPASLIGCQISRYEVQSLLGAGGMGEVYLARDLKLDRQVAIKILPAQFTEDGAQVRRFEREACAASALNHPNIITIYEIGRDQDIHFIAIEYVPGQTLREKIADGKMGLQEAIRIAVQITGALQAAHAAGIVHRDIKPENVMVRPDGLVKVLDFGLAKPVAREPLPGRSQGPQAVTVQTDPGMLMGTIVYLSPEQVLRREVDPRTDIFSLGILLHELVTGRRPFTGNNATDICDSILRDAPTIGGDLPQAIKRVIRRALEKDRAARYQTAYEMRADLERLARETSGAGKRPSRAWHHKAAMAVGALAISALVVATLMRREAAPGLASFSTGSVKRVTDTAGQEIFPSLSPDGNAIVYASRVSGNWDIYLQKVGEAQAVNLTGNSKHVDLAPAFSPDGRRVAFHSSREGGGIFTMGTDGRDVTHVSSEGHNPAWSPDGREIVFATDRIFDYEGRNSSSSRLFAVDVRTGERRPITTVDAVQPSWSPNGHRVAFWGVQKGAQKDIWTVSSAGGEPVPVTDDRAVDWNPVWSRDGKHLYFLSDRGGSMNLWRVPVDELTGAVAGQVEPATLPSANSQHLSFSADGQSVVYVEMNRRENTYQVPFDPVTGSVTGEAVQITRGIRRYSHPDLSPDEQLLAFVSAAEAQEDLFVIDGGDAQPINLTDDPAQDRYPRWSPDGEHLAFLSDRSGKYEIWKVNKDGSGLEQLTDVPGTDVLDPVWAPDGKRLLYNARGLNMFIIEPGRSRAEQTPRPLPGDKVPGFRPWSWSPDGKLLAGWRLRPELPETRLAIYSFVTGRFEHLPYRSINPFWLNDSRLLLSVMLGKMYLLDTRSRQWREIYNVEPYCFGVFRLSKDNRRLYYSLVSTEADIWFIQSNRKP